MLTKETIVRCPVCGKITEAPIEQIGELIDCPHCGQVIEVKPCSQSNSAAGTRGVVSIGAAPQTAQSLPTSRPNPALRVIGGIVLVIGVGVLLRFLAFDTTVEVPPVVINGVTTAAASRVHNIGLMQERQIGITVGMLLTAIGSVCLIVNAYMARRR